MVFDGLGVSEIDTFTIHGHRPRSVEKSTAGLRGGEWATDMTKQILDGSDAELLSPVMNGGIGGRSVFFGSEPPMPDMPQAFQNQGKAVSGEEIHGEHEIEDLAHGEFAAAFFVAMMLLQDLIDQIGWHKTFDSLQASGFCTRTFVTLFA
jgi:hypothetical protein